MNTHLSPLAKHIRDIRVVWGWSQERLAKALHCDQASISFWERDKIVPSGVSLVALACLCGTTVYALQTGKGWETPAEPANLPAFED